MNDCSAPMAPALTSSTVFPKRSFMGAVAIGRSGWIAAIEGGTDEQLLSAPRGPFEVAKMQTFVRA